MGKFLRGLNYRPPVNCFPWEYKLRSLQIVLAVILSIILCVIHQTSPTCTAPKTSAEAYVNTFCQNVRWFHIGNYSKIVPRNEDIRSFNSFNFLLPNIFVVVLICLLNLHPVAKQCVKEAREIAKYEDNSQTVDELNAKMTRKEIERDFVAKWFIHTKPIYAFGKYFPLRTLTSHRYFLYLASFLLINLISAVSFHPGMYPFRRVIACRYDHAGTKAWTNCVIHGIGATHTCLWIMFLIYLINIFSCLISCFIIFISPRVLLRFAKQKIIAYADDVTHETCLRDFARSNTLLHRRNTHALYLMSLMWAHLGDTASWLVVAYMDVLKDQRIFAILNEINKVFSIKVTKKPCTENIEKRAYRTMIHDVTRSGERRSDSFENIYESKEESETDNDGDNEIPGRLQQWENIFCKDYEYSRNLFHLYKVSVLMEKDLAFQDIDHQPTKSSMQVKVFENSGKTVPFWSASLREENWIDRKWGRDYKLMLLAIQAPRDNVLAAPTRFTISVDEPTSNKSGDRSVDSDPAPFDHTVDSWLADEWKVFALCGYGRSGELLVHKYPTGKAIKLTMLTNGGENFYELQNLKVFGSPVEFAAEAIKRTTVPLYDNGHHVTVG